MRDPDSVVEEVRAARDAIAKAADYDVDKIAQAAKARETKGGRDVVRLPPKKATVVRKVS